MAETEPLVLGRRAFLRGGTLTLLAADLDLSPARLCAAESTIRVRGFRKQVGYEWGR